MAKLNLRQIEAFRALMMTGGVTAAAQLMGVTQPAVSRLLRDLQDDLGYRLFERRGTGLVPTPEASALYAEVERSFIGLDRIQAAAEEIRSRRAGLLRVAALPALANGFLPRFAGGFVAARPKLDLGLFGLISSLVVDWVVNRQCDLGFAEFPIINPEIPAIPMPVLDRVAVMPEGHPLTRKAVITPEDMAGETFVSLQTGVGSRHKIDGVFAERGIQRVIRIETHLSEIMCGLVASGVGVSICDPFTAAEFRTRGVVARPFRPSIPFEFAALSPPGQTLSRVAQDFVEAFAAHIRAFGQADGRPGRAARRPALTER